MVISIFMFYYQKKGIPSENPFLFRKELIANRLKKVLPKLIHDSQTSFLKGRNINENIRTIFEVLDYVKEKDIPGLIFFQILKKLLTV